MAYLAIAESKSDAPLAELMGYDKWPRDIVMAFERARGVLSVKYIKNRENLKNDFASVVDEFRLLEAEYLGRLGDNAENAQQVQRIITEMLLQAARDTEQPFETCQLYWENLQRLGFYRIERRCNETWLFADTCLEHGQIDIGLEVLDPLIADLERLRAEPSVTEQATKYYDQELGYLRKLRNELEAQRA